MNKPSLNFRNYNDAQNVICTIRIIEECCISSFDRV
jgi:hypothetical protein